VSRRDENVLTIDEEEGSRAMCQGRKIVEDEDGMASSHPGSRTSRPPREQNTNPFASSIKHTIVTNFTNNSTSQKTGLREKRAVCPNGQLCLGIDNNDHVLIWTERMLVNQYTGIPVDC
jgi:hypothetical protein